ncbi:16S rRNA (adenine(1518)-N(6)/adenine(1519)-N(6))-dimethyltransferase RsmA [Pannus brasiliensis CCIBt3594]|uniref:Ribosomal RNA small subunit methyltransferase A n=1 Tax=Pannus brasiliensis CCIBt3594 TaxID=1427578 RepID=A0AAW9R1M2_9CHRO
MSIQPRKRFGQHWLKDESILDRIVDAADLRPEDRVLEIGPGTGILTRRLLGSAGSVIAVEIDRDLCAKLPKIIGNKPNFQLIQGDILAIDPDTLGSPNKVVANIPYNITGPILEKLLGSIARPRTPAYDSIVLLIQKEVAERLVAVPSTKAYGGLSVRVRYLADCDWIADVPSRAFSPPPKVDSAVVRLRPRPLSPPVDRPKQLETLIALGFANRRKMLRNNLKSSIEPERLTRILTQLEIDPLCRAEDLSLSQWIALHDRLNETIEA